MFDTLVSLALWLEHIHEQDSLNCNEFQTEMKGLAKVAPALISFRLRKWMKSQ